MAIKRLLADSNMDAPTFLDECIEVLQHGSAQQKQDVALFLGHFGDPEAIGPLVDELDHPDDEVRKSVCNALNWLQANGDMVEAKLLTLCRGDRSPGVRVWAALALCGSHKKDAVAAYRFGLKSDDWRVWQLCEEELERMGKLELPLPEHIYTKITPEEYKAMRSSGRPWFGREIKKNGKLYFERYDGGVDGVPICYEWYQVRLPEK
jgi:HEAT repeat protein